MHTEIRKLSMTPTSVTFGGLLDDYNEFHIPLYQRDYTWSSDEVGDFIDDVLNSFDTRSARFFGTILLSDTSPDQVFIPDRTIRFVIDGQQRLTTLLICLSALRHLVLDLQDSNRTATAYAERIFLKLSVEINPQGKRAPRLYANRENNQYLAALLSREVESKLQAGIIFSQLPTKSIQRSSTVLKDCYDHVYRRMRDAVAFRTTGIPVPDDDPEGTLGSILRTQDEAVAGADKILEIFNFLLQHSNLVRIEIKDWVEAFDLFDGLNNRGMELAKRDVLKNVLLSRAAKEDPGSGLKDLEKSWLTFERLLSDKQLSENQFVKFLRHFLLLRHENVSLSGAARIFIEETNSQSPRETLSQLIRAAECYRKIIEPSSDPDLNAETSALLESLDALSAERVRPIILAAMLQNVNAKELNRLLVAIETLYFRRSTICQQDNKSLEGMVQELAANIFQRGMSAIGEAIKAINLANPKDDLFVKMFEVKSGMPAKAARYMLLKLENHQVANGGLLVEGGTLEHILPQDPSSHWGLDKNDPDTNELINRLGNLTLLRQSENSKAKNGPFLEKRAIYGDKNESLRINRHVLDQSEWGRKQIDARQKQLAEIALKVWPVQEA